jgi:hypothetical protein
VRQVYKCGQTEASHYKSTQKLAQPPNPVGPFLPRRVYNCETQYPMQRKNGPTCLQNSWAVFASIILLSPSRAGRKPLSTHRTHDTLKVDAAHPWRRNQASTFRAYRIEGRPHFFEINLPRSRHGSGVLVIFPAHCSSCRSSTEVGAPHHSLVQRPVDMMDDTA